MATVEQQLGELTAALVQMRQDNATLLSRMSEQQAEIHRLTTTAVANKTTMRAKIETLESLMAKSKTGEKPKTLLDNKGLGKPKTFTGEMSQFHYLSKLVNFVTGVFDFGRECMEWAASQGDTTITQRYCNAQLDMYMSEAELVEFNRQLYTALAELCEGEALKITKNTPNKLGLKRGGS